MVNWQRDVENKRRCKANLTGSLSGRASVIISIFFFFFPPPCLRGLYYLDLTDRREISGFAFPRVVQLDTSSSLPALTLCFSPLPLFIFRHCMCSTHTERETVFFTISLNKSLGHPKILRVFSQSYFQEKHTYSNYPTGR